ncbi:MAG: hypothetical protein IH840_15115 [Candidatus Heimdallarchaeota archaeon]|nr:hypothetical protein [Candidatus Heimdallarchaeota archaeon]
MIRRLLNHPSTKKIKISWIKESDPYSRWRRLWDESQ